MTSYLVNVDDGGHDVGVHSIHVHPQHRAVRVLAAHIQYSMIVAGKRRVINWILIQIVTTKGKRLYKSAVLPLIIIVAFQNQ